MECTRGIFLHHRTTPATGASAAVDEHGPSMSIAAEEPITKPADDVYGFGDLEDKDQKIVAAVSANAHKNTQDISNVFFYF